MMKKALIKKLTSLMAQDGLDAVLVCPSEELVYLIGFTPMMCKRFQGLFIKSDGDFFYVCNLLYLGELENALPDIRAFTWFDGDDMAGTVKEILESEGLLGKKIGVNCAAPAFSVLDIAEKTGIRFVNAKHLLEEMRIIKTDEELENLRISASITDMVFSDVIKFVKPGMREGEVKGFLFSEMSKRGAIKPWALVASGPNSSFPHYMGEERVIEAQDVVLLDLGVRIMICVRICPVWFLSAVLRMSRGMYTRFAENRQKLGRRLVLRGRLYPILIRLRGILSVMPGMASIS